MTDAPAQQETGDCALCKRPGQRLMFALRPGMTSRAGICTDEASCVRARIARDVRAEQEQPARSAWRDAAERHIGYTDSHLEGEAVGTAQVRATQAVAYALLAVAEAITLAPSTDLTGILDGALEAIRGELASHVVGTAQ